MKAEELMIGDWVALKEMPELHMRVRAVLSNGYIEVKELKKSEDDFEKLLEL